MKFFYDDENHFMEVFDERNGMYVRSGELDESGHETGIDPFMRKFPALLDVGIMRTCLCAHKCKIDCYQKAIDSHGANMSVEDYESIMKQSSGKVWQCLHEDEVVLVRNSIGMVSCKKIKDVNIGDYVYCGKNNFARVYEKHEKTDDVFEVNVGYGKTIIATKEHKFMTESGLKTVEQLVIGDVIKSAKKDCCIEPLNYIDVVKLIVEVGLDNEFYIDDSCAGLVDVCKEHGIKYQGHSVLISKIKDYLDVINYRDAEIIRERSQYHIKAVYRVTEDFMKLLGHYIGNGSRRAYVISSQQVKMIESIRSVLDDSFPNFTYKVYDDGVTTKIELSSFVLHSLLFDKIFKCRTENGEKQLPNFLYSVSRRMKIAFLAGYFCDGNLRTTKTDGNYGSITFNTSSKKLFNDVCMLLATLDVDYSINTEEAKDVEFSKNDARIIHRRKRYRVIIQNLIEVFKINDVVLDHKDSDDFNGVINSFHDPNDLRVRKPYIVKSITPCNEKAVVVDINIDSDDHLFVTSHGIITHNCAVGGAGDPDTHEQFKQILEITRKYDIVPNFTTSGIAFTTDKAKLCKDYTGAVAVSEHNADYTRKAIDMLLDVGVKTNVHYVLNNQTIDDAINKLETGYYNGINAVVFLLYKPIGLGVQEKVLKPDDARLAMFFDVVDHNHCKHKIGFDSCTCAGIVNHTRNVNMDSIDFCEAARYSAYIDADMNMMPCSFGNQNPKYFVSLRDHTIEEAWHSEVFEQFRDYMQFACPNCQNRSQCGGGCPICKDIVLCNRAERTTY